MYQGMRSKLFPIGPKMLFLIVLDKGNGNGSVKSYLFFQYKVLFQVPGGHSGRWLVQPENWFCFYSGKEVFIMWKGL